MPLCMELLPWSGVNRSTVGSISGPEIVLKQAVPIYGLCPPKPACPYPTSRRTYLGYALTAGFSSTGRVPVKRSHFRPYHLARQTCCPWIGTVPVPRSYSQTTALSRLPNGNPIPTLPATWLPSPTWGAIQTPLGGDLWSLSRNVQPCPTTRLRHRSAVPTLLSIIVPNQP